MQTQRLLYIEGLRTVSALLVVIHHMSLAFFPYLYFGNTNQIHMQWETLIHHTPLYLLVRGDFALAIFFMVSAFVLLKSFTQKSDYSKAIAKRVFRLGVPIFFAVMFSWFLHTTHIIDVKNLVDYTKSYNWLSTQTPRSTAFTEALRQGVYGYLKGDVASEKSLNSSLWMMHYIFVGSLITLLFVVITKEFGATLRIFMYALGIWYFGFSFYSYFLIGLIIAELAAVKFILPTPLSLLMLLLSMYISTVPFNNVFTSFHKPLTFLPFTGQQYMFMGAALMFFTIVKTPALQALLSARPFTRYAPYTYSIFLLHVPIFLAIASLILPILPFSYTLNIVITAAVGMAATLFASRLFYCYIEEKATKKVLEAVRL